MTSAMAMTTNTYQPVSTVCSPLTSWPIASVTMNEAAADEDRGLAERAEVLRAAVAVVVVLVAGRPPRRIARNVRMAAMTSPEDSIPAEIRPKLPVTMPVPSLSTTSTAAAAIETRAVRD